MGLSLPLSPVPRLRPRPTLNSSMGVLTEPTLTLMVDTMDIILTLTTVWAAKLPPVLTLPEHPSPVLPTTDMPSVTLRLTPPLMLTTHTMVDTPDTTDILMDMDTDSTDTPDTTADTAMVSSLLPVSMLPMFPSPALKA